ncbi:hypothetical protein FRB99_003839 [Tulasnella sp. 403]|nr:hypothetical protein FRB99_003839 [Tulasnella sp. 403]
MDDLPHDKSSRWSGIQQGGPNAFRQRQWITLRLDKVAVLKAITFGKHHTRHPCNLREFKIYVGLDSEQMTEVLHSGLNNDSIPESFSVRYQTQDGMVIPCQFVKIVPLAAWEYNYNTSIWFVALHGVVQRPLVDMISSAYVKHREAVSLRLVAKHLRSRQLPYEEILESAGVRLEHPTISQLYESLVINGDFEEAERLICCAGENDSLFTAYLFSADPNVIWRRLDDSSPDSLVPSPRGGHQMVLDAEHRTAYLFGGWSGSRTFADLWAYSIQEHRWSLVSADVSKDGGPDGRNCHSMIFDSKTGGIYILGKYIDNFAGREVDPKCFKSDFWKYSVRTRRWTRISEDTAAEGGPPVICNHCMVVDSENGLIVVFGGQKLTPESARSGPTIVMSGMYTYHIPTNKWTLEFEDPGVASGIAASKASLFIPSRLGMGMVFDDATRTTYIFGGHKFVNGQKQYMSDMWTFSLKTKEIAEVCSDCSAEGGPDPGFCQRVMLDNDLREIYFMSGLTRDQVLDREAARCTLWIYSITYRRWVRVREEELSDKMDVDDSGEDNTPNPADRPVPRFASQTVYDRTDKTFLMFGGNDGMNDEKRLGDFWSLAIERPRIDEVLRRAKLMLRMRRFKELSATASAVDALRYLRTQVHELVDHKGGLEPLQFQRLAQCLLKPQPLPTDGVSTPTPGLGNERRPSAMTTAVEVPSTNDRLRDESGDARKLPEDLFRPRFEVFQSLMELINPEAREPEASLLDWVTRDRTPAIPRWY